MPLVDIHLIEGVFDKQQKQEMITKVTDAMVSIEGETMRGLTWVRIYEVASGQWGIGGTGMTTADVKAVQQGKNKEPAMALELRPNCEYCDRDLPPQSTIARICSFECTFCADCVEHTLHNVCPNCGGGFVPRPIRPATEWRAGLSIAKRPPSDKRVGLSYSAAEIADFVATIKDIPPENR